MSSARQNLHASSGRGRERLWFGAFIAVLLGWLGTAANSRAQIDPKHRELIQLGYNQPLQGKAPISGYAFYYVNEPGWYQTNYTMRLAVAPIYLDAELGLENALGPNTDVGLGLSGGGFADSYSEIRQGKFLESESFTGHGGGISASIYHLFNPGSLIPLHGVFRAEGRVAVFSRDDDTDADFELPSDQGVFTFRSGLRWGGREPLLVPDVGMELSLWHESRLRTHGDAYGFDNDRRLETDTHLFWGRALLIYTLPELKHTMNASLTAGFSVDADRFSAYRLGGVLPLAGEFPLNLPGYYWQEISAERFALLGIGYTLPFTSERRWAVVFQGATGVVDYAPGVSQPGHWHSGVGGGIMYRSASEAWQILLGYAYGVDAIRSDGRGAHSVGFLLQFDLSRAKLPFFDPGQQPNRSRFLDRIFGR